MTAPLIRLLNPNVTDLYAYDSASFHNLIGVSMTNTEAIMVPTFGRRAMLGTDPIAVAMPALAGDRGTESRPADADRDAPHRPESSSLGLLPGTPPLPSATPQADDDIPTLTDIVMEALDAISQRRAAFLEQFLQSPGGGR